MRMCTIVLLVFAACTAWAAAATADCGASRATLEMSLGAVKMPHEPLRMRSLEALATIQDAGGTAGWLGIDDRGAPWIEFSTRGARLRSLLGSHVLTLDRRNLFNPLLTFTVLPVGFTLEPCTSR